MTGLYVHIPFCKSKCRYCDFNSFANCEEHIASYFSALMAEAKTWKIREVGRKFDTLYFGGGTPSYVEPKLLGETVNRLLTTYDFAEDTEVTVECNPGTINFDGFKILKNSGVNRLSIGLQSANNETLKTLDRIHTIEDFERCFDAARRGGFDNISLDLMYGLPDMTMEDWEYSLDRAIAFNPEHISTYALKIEEGTPFSKMKLNLPDEDLCADMYEKSVEILEKYGFMRYEISNFAKKGYESRHNTKYWRLTDYLGLGAGAYSCLDGKRFSNYCGLEEYVVAVEKNGEAVCEEEDISIAEQMSEFVFLGLRCTAGISVLEFKERFGKDITEIFGEQIKKYCHWGFMELEKGRLKFKNNGFFVSNTILADFV